MANKIALVDDDQNILTSVSLALEAEGFSVDKYLDGEQGLNGINRQPPDLLVLDIKMPRLDGMEVLERLRKTSNLPVIFLTSKDDEVDEALGLRIGADDYIKKPIKPKLLISRVNALLRRNKKNYSNYIKISDLEINKDNHILLYKKKEIHLSRKEFALLYYLMSMPGKVFTRNEILSEIWDNINVTHRTIDVHIRRIREKIGDHRIKTIKGVGYKFID